MTRFVVPALAVLAAAGCKTMSSASEPMGEAAQYQVVFTGTWTAKTHPLEYPRAGAFTGPHFSGLIGATHRPGYALFEDGAAPSPGLERLSEEGKHSPLDQEIRAAIGSGSAGALFETGPLRDTSGSIETAVRVDADHSRVSAVAMIAPSPDWFTGASDVELRENGRWVDAREVVLYAWDSGGDDGTTYEAPDLDTSPKKATALNDSPHFVQMGKRVPVARLTFRKLSPAGMAEAR